ncbi:lipase family protein [Actinokineospora fastidiosa]|uniref:Lipase n=1 Tax=Actinokineospora fastidiosa TaxID=1816 RepID=A0A918GN44_9PSEU|nr:lipase family protein [Actinokineospora fastidiosa]GGS48036.1 lipase [Actinokineospora fastidiosa]
MLTTTTRPRRLAAVCAALAAALAATLAAAPAGHAQSAPQPRDDSFYEPPSPLPSGAPGDVIRSRPTTAVAVADRAKAWQVMYRSTDALGQPMAVVGTVLVPNGVDPATAPVVSFAAGTHGPAFRCRVSYMSQIGAFYEQPAVNDMLAQGWVVLMTDYEGYRPQPKTTYVTGRSEGHAVIDMVRAAQRMPEVRVGASSKVMFRGYSQGGGASLWAAELAPQYAPELNLIGVVAGGVPADLVQVTLFLEGKFGFGFLLYALSGLDNAYPELDLEKYLNDTGRAAVAEMAAGDCTLELLVKYQGKRLNEFMTTSPVLTEAWLARVQENKLGGAAIGVPVLQYHGIDDNIVAYRQAKQLSADYCAKGVALTWKELPKDHIAMVFHGNKDALAFMKDRVAGAPAAPTCA